MITCQHARNLFDRHLDGELPASLQAELHAHQLSCVDCQMELAILEACGDVVALDRREPALSASFTDRVLLANRAQMIPKRRRWGRMFLVASAPMAAAASIALAVLLIPPTPAREMDHRVLGSATAVSDPVASMLGASTKDRAALAGTEQMPASFVDRLLQPGVEQARNSVDGIRQGVERLESLVRMGFARNNEALAAGRSPSSPSLGSPSLTPGLPDFTDPSLLFQSPAPVQPSGRNVDEVLEAL